MKTLLAVVLFAALALPQGAHALPSAARMRSKLNQNVVPSDGNLFRLGDQLTDKRIGVMKVTWDAQKTGSTGGYALGKVGASSLRDVDGTAATIPSGALVKSAWIDVTGTIQTNSPNLNPTLAFQLQTSEDLMTQVKFTGFQANGTTAFRQIMPINGNTILQLTADRIVTSVVTGGALTGGTVNLFIEYFLP